MGAYLFEQYMDLAAAEAPRFPEDDAGRAAFMADLEVPELAVAEPAAKETFTRVVGEGRVVLDALRAAEVPADRHITPQGPGSLSLGSAPVGGWYLTELAGSRHYAMVPGELPSDPLPVMLGEDRRLHVYHRLQGTGVDGFLDHRYVLETSTAADNQALVMAYALQVVRHQLEVPGR